MKHSIYTTIYLDNCPPVKLQTIATTDQITALLDKGHALRWVETGEIVTYKNINNVVYIKELNK